MKDPLGVRVTGPLARYAAGFVAELVEVGYRPNAAAVQLRLFAHLSRGSPAGCRPSEDEPRPDTLGADADRGVQAARNVDHAPAGARAGSMTDPQRHALWVSEVAAHAI